MTLQELLGEDLVEIARVQSVLLRVPSVKFALAIVLQYGLGALFYLLALRRLPLVATLVSLLAAIIVAPILIPAHARYLRLLATFAVSGILHEYAFDLPAGRVLGSQMAFFLIVPNGTVQWTRWQ